MANEEQLRQNWGDAFHGSSVYQRAKQEDAYAMTRRERAARDDMHAALLRGDTRRASAIQQQLQREQSRPGVNSQAADNYQKQRVTDYIDQARARGQQQAAELRAQPLSGVFNSDNYLQGLENPDFANHMPAARAHFGVGYGSAQKAPRTPAATRAVSVTKAPVVRPDPTGALEAARRSGAERENASLIRERDFSRNLLPELRTPMTNFMAQATAGEKKDFISHDPVWRYGRLREQQYRDSKVPTAKPPPMGSASKPSAPLFSGSIKAPGANTGLGLGQPSPYVPANTMPVTSPVMSSKPVSSLAQPPAVSVQQTGSSFFQDVLDDGNDDSGDPDESP